MALVFAAITPHPPILIPTIGKDKLEALEKTKTALEQLEQDLYITKPDLIFIISPHTGAFKNTFTIIKFIILYLIISFKKQLIEII